MGKVYTLAYFKRQGKLGGLARKASLTPERRSEIAAKARRSQLSAKQALKSVGTHS